LGQLFAGLAATNLELGLVIHLAKQRASIASFSKIGSINETSSSCRCRAVLGVRSIAVSQEGCLWDGRVVANLKPTPAGVPEMPEEPFFKRRIGFEFLF